MLKLFWYCLDLNKSNEERITQYFKELTELLQKAPTYIKLIVKPLPVVAATELKKILCKPHLDFNKYQYELSLYCIREKIEDSFSPLLICCKRESQIAIAVRNSDPSGLVQWGGVSGCFGFSWELNNKYSLWHETLHIFGADECYTPDNFGPTCELPNCIMQYIPKKETVGDWPFLCCENVKRIQEWMRKYVCGDSVNKLTD